MLNTRSMCLLNEHGDTEITWTPDVDAKMLAVIQAKMNNGVTFYILAPDNNNSVTQKKVTSVFDIGSERKITVPDSDFDELFAQGIISIGKREPQNETVTIGIAKTAEEVSKNNTIGINRRQGG